MKTWVLNGDVLEVEEGDKRLLADVNDIYAAVVEDRTAWADLPSGRCGDAAKLNFSRFPVEWLIVIAPCTTTGGPQVTFEAQTQTGSSFPASATALACGHVVHEGTWHPGAPGSSEDITALLAEAGCPPEGGYPETLKAILHLKKIALRGGPVIDRLSANALDTLIFKNDAGRPKGIKAALYPYQHDGWRWLRLIIREHLGGVLADEMGLGKTLQVISALRDPGGNSVVGGALVIAPSSILENWIREIEKFCPDLHTLKHQGALRTGRPIDLEGFDVVVASYDTVIRDLSLLKMIEWQIVILDEAQNIRNPDALRTKSVKQIPRKVGLAVTGTPIENRLSDLWSIMDFAVPDYLGNLKSFEMRYGENIAGATALEPLISPLMLRRRVADVAKDLPERIDIEEVLEMNTTEATDYEAVREAVFEEYGANATLVSLGKLRQFCAHPEIVDNAAAKLGTGFSKFERLKELLEEIFLRNEKVLVFTSYIKMADRIAVMAAEEFGAMAATLDGRLHIDERQPLIDRFSAHCGPAVLILNPRAGGSGLNITAANHVVHYNPEWNPALEDQASARAHRRGQDRPVTVRRLIYADTVEEVIGERLQRKRDIANAAIVGVEGKEENHADIMAALLRSPFSAKAN
ncbi:DEAD/DEAH box helicase [Spectribacter hydrogenoxidans]|uniref:DEAD/DEAH box helicase n=1 Tax=Spectribacter hydrogenoxidans TaxID=3075608 RepID=A0ABU3C3W6_9GAMM|nr:DEAD/DEAH box helicase [Salinisphaera sp. W335]MDT0636248.1 DEAD/DEAH box helicase [Salinisphaera sp. W335]